MRMLITVLSIFIIISTNGYAWHERPGPEGGPPVGGPDRGFDRLIDSLELTDSQIDKIAKIRLEYRKKMIDLTAQIGKARIEYEETLFSPKPDQKKLKELTDKIVTLSGKILRAKLEQHQKIIGVLNNKQRKEIKRAWLRHEFARRKHGKKFRKKIFK